MEGFKKYRLGDVITVLDYKRIPLSSKDRESRQGKYPYYGAQGIIDFIDEYLFDGSYLLIAEDGENVKSQKEDIARIASGQYWVNNHAHIVVHWKDLVWDNGMVEDTQYSNVYDQKALTLRLRPWNDYETTYNFSL